MHDVVAGVRVEEAYARVERGSSGKRFRGKAKHARRLFDRLQSLRDTRRNCAALLSRGDAAANEQLSVEFRRLSAEATGRRDSRRASKLLGPSQLSHFRAR